MNNTDQVAQIALFQVDASIMEIMLGLGCGGTVHMIHKEHRHNNTLLIEYLNNTKITTAILVPSIWQSIDNLCHESGHTLSHLKRIITTGEAANVELIKRWMRHVIIMNAYGPTEMSFGVSLGIVNLNNIKDLKKHKSLVSIGIPMKGIIVAIVEYKKNYTSQDEFKILATINDKGQVSIKQKGEIIGEIIAIDVNEAIGGQFIEYTNVSEHMSQIRLEEVLGNYQLNKTGKIRAYRTGDLGCIAENDLFVLERCSLGQVKKHGLLVEIKEIKLKLEEYVRSASCKFPVFSKVHVVHDKTSEQFVAYLNCINPVSAKELILSKYPKLAKNPELLFIDIRNFASQDLQNFKLPSRWCLNLEETYRDKTNQLATGDHLHIIYRSEEDGISEHNPHNSTMKERAVAESIKMAWGEVLSGINANKINYQTNFNELGGDSHLFTLMLPILKKYLLQNKLIAEHDKVFDHDLSYRLINKPILGDAVHEILPYVISDQKVRKNIIFEKKVDGSIEKESYNAYPVTYLFRSPFSTDSYCNLHLKKALSRINDVIELILPCEIDIDSHAVNIEKQTQGMVDIILADMAERVHAKYKDRLTLIGHSAGGTIAYQIGLQLAKKNIFVSVIMLDTPSSEVAQKINVQDYRQYIGDCITNTCEGGIGLTSLAIDLRKSFETHYAISSSHDNDFKDSMINCAEEILISASGKRTESINKIKVIMNSCRAELKNYQYNEKPPNNIKVLLMTSQEYRDKLNRYINKPEHPSSYLCWPKDLFSQPPVTEIVFSNHQDFVIFNEGTLDKISENVKCFIACNILRERIEESLVSNSCFIEPLTSDRGNLFNKVKDSLFTQQATTVILEGDAGAGKSLCLRQFTQRLLHEVEGAGQGGYIPIHISLNDPVISKVFDLNAQNTPSLMQAYLNTFGKRKGKAIEALINSSNLLFILDECDDINISVNLYEKCIEGLAGVRRFKAIYACRTESLRNERELESVYGYKGQQCHRHKLCGFTENNVAEYIEQSLIKSYKNVNISYAQIAKEKMDYIKKIPGLIELTKNPRLLTIILDIISNIDISNLSPRKARSTLYANLFKLWLDHRVIDVFKNPKMVGEGNNFSSNDLMYYSAIYTINLAIRLWEKVGSECNISAGNIDDESTLDERLLEPTPQAKKAFISIFKDATIMGNGRPDDMERIFSGIEARYFGERSDYPRIISDSDFFSGRYAQDGRGMWQKEVDKDRVKHNREQRIKLIRSCSLLKISHEDLNEKRFQFLHRSIIGFLKCNGFFSDLKDELIMSTSFLTFNVNDSTVNAATTVLDRSQLTLVTERYQSDEDNRNYFTNLLWKIVFSTRYHTGMEVASSNALSLIVAMNPYICDVNLSDISAPFATLTNAICWNSIFNGADFYGALMFQSDFTNAEFINTKFSDRTNNIKAKFVGDDDILVNRPIDTFYIKNTNKFDLFTNVIVGNKLHRLIYTKGLLHYSILLINHAPYTLVKSVYREYRSKGGLIAMHLFPRAGLVVLVDSAERLICKPIEYFSKIKIIDGNKLDLDDEKGKIK